MQKCAFIFPGQGAQYVGMGRSLYESYPQAKDIFDRASGIVDFDIKKLCFEGPAETLSSTKNSQVAILTTSLAALTVLNSVEPNRFACLTTFGLSLGEYSALVASGALEFKDALGLVKKRGQFMEEAAAENPGKMLCVIGLAKEVVEGICRKTSAEIANLNSPGQVVVSCRAKDAGSFQELAAEKGAKKVVTLDVSGPFHSSYMQSASEKLKNELAAVPIKPPQIPIVSNVTADYEKDPDEIRKNLSLQVSHTMRFEDSVRRVVKDGITTFVEIGPGKVLKGLLRRIDPTCLVYNFETSDDIRSLTS